MIKPDIILCDIITTVLSLTASRVVVYNQNFRAPNDDNLYIVVSEGPTRIIGNTNRFDHVNDKEIKCVAISTTYNIEITSRNTDAKYRAPEVVAALSSVYCEQKQEENKIRIFRTNQITDLSFIEGRSALHRYQIPVIINSVQRYEKAITTYNQFPGPTILAEPQ